MCWYDKQGQGAVQKLRPFPNACMCPIAPPCSCSNTFQPSMFLIWSFYKVWWFIPFWYTLTLQLTASPQRLVKRAVQTNCSLHHWGNPTLQDWRKKTSKNVSGRVGEITYAWPCPSGIQFPLQKRVIIGSAQVFLSALSTGPRERRKGKPPFELDWGSCKSTQNYTFSPFILFPGVTCWRGCMCIGRVGSLCFLLLFGCHPSQVLVKVLLIFLV